jgi:hypothetical protein
LVTKLGWECSFISQTLADGGWISKVTYKLGGQRPNRSLLLADV